MSQAVRRGLRRTVVASLCLGFFALTVAPALVARAADPQVAEDVLLQDEAWHFRYRQPLEPAPDPDDPSGNEFPAIVRAEVRGRTNFYAMAEAETLHVGVNLGEVEAVMLLGLPLLELGEGGLPPVVTGGKITMSDAGSDFGSRNAGGAEMVACLVTDFWVSAIGADWSDLPPYDCGVRSTATLVEGADPLTWTIDLAPFAGAWSEPEDNFGVIVVPDPDSASPRPAQTWHVAFENNLYQPEEGEQARPIRATVRYVPQELPDFFGAEEFPQDADPPGTGQFSAPPAEPGGFASGPGQTFEPGPAGPEPEPQFDDGGGTSTDAGAAAPPATGPGVAMAPAGERSIENNPALYLLPFLGLGLMGLLGYSLSQEPDPPSAREGAVSRLMRQRRGGLG